MLTKLSEIPVGGRLQFFLQKLGKITQDKWVLSVMREGYQLDFLEKFPFIGVKETKVSAKNLSIYQKEIDSLLEKGVIIPVSANNTLKGFYSTFFFW